jgi:hypothetical protein
MALLAVGLAVLMRSDWTLLLLIPGIDVHYELVKSEEHYLERSLAPSINGTKEQCRDTAGVC